MTNPTRTRAEIQADEAAEIDQQIQALTEKRKALSACWISGYRLPDTEYGRRRVEIQMSGGDVVRPLLDDSVVCIPAADLIPREEHERLLEEAGGKLTSLDANTAVKYLASEYDLDTGHMDTAEPRWYPFDHNGHIYEVVVRRKGEADVAPAQAIQAAESDAEPVGYANCMSDDAWSRIYASKEIAQSLAQYGGWDEIAVPLYRHPAPQEANAVAPKGVVARLLALGDCLKDAEKPWMSSITRAIANEITELPEPSECDYDWRPYFSNGAYCIVITPQMGGTIGVRPHQVPYFIAALIERAALLAKEAE